MWCERGMRSDAYLTTGSSPMFARKDSVLKILRNTETRNGEKKLDMRGMFVNVFFFFQAEDGIRDKLVTGVQTCALPILSPISRCAAPTRIPSANRFTTSGAVPYM